MLKEFVLNHVFTSSILAVGIFSLLMQALMTMFLKDYVKASANMKTTKKKLLLNLKNQFEAMYGMDCQVRNTEAYVDKYLLKLRFLGLSFLTWEKIPFLSAGIAVLLTVAGIFYEYIRNENTRAQVEILSACGIVLACLFIFFHIYGIKSRKSQIQIQLVDYLENYMTNRLTRVRDGREGKEEIVSKGDEDGDVPEESSEQKESADQENGEPESPEEDMEMLKRLLAQVEHGETKNVPSREQRVRAAYAESQIEPDSQIAVSREEQEETFSDITYESFAKEPEESEIELLEEFVQSFLA
ncbi:MAG: hypothetical protein NC347_01710 [Clostridium sp.]|nr:hypothetical protein [Clostridium sp.]